MPCSIEACRTVFPFSTVTWRPSIVRVTPFSITLRSYPMTGDRCAPRARLPDDVRQRRAVPVRFHAPDRPFRLETLFDRAVGDAHDEVVRPAVGVRHRHRDRHVVDRLALLLELHP